MTVKKQPVLAQEAMQEDIKFFEDLTKAIGVIRKSNKSKEAVKKAGIHEIVKKRTKMNILFDLDRGGTVNAYMIPPNIDRNNPFFTSADINIGSNSSDRRNIVKNGVPKGPGITNDANYTVGGVWEDVPVVVKLGTGLFNAPWMDDEQLAAILLHELGHVYTYFTLLGKITLKNFLISEAVKDILGAPTLEERVQTIKFVGNKLNIDFKDPESIAQAPEKLRGELFEGIIIAETALNANSTSVTSIYDTRNVEQLADQFAVYFGAGPAIAKNLIDTSKAFGDSSSYSTTSFVIMEAIKLSVVVISAGTFPILTGVLLLAMIPGVAIYDDPAARVTLIRKTLVGQIRNFKNDPEMVSRLKDQIDTLDQLDKMLKDRPTLYQYIYRTISPRGRTMYRQEVFMKSIENLLYTDTYLNAVKFGALAK